MQATEDYIKLPFGTDPKNPELDFFSENYNPDDFKTETLTRARKTGKSHFRKYERGVMEAGMEAIRQVQAKFKLTLVKFTGKMYLRKIYEFQEDIIKYGMSEGSDFKVINKTEEGAIAISGTITTEDEVLRAKLRDMALNEVFILKCDEANSLNLANLTRIQDILEKQLFTCYIKKLPSFIWPPPNYEINKNDFPDGNIVRICKTRYLALFVLYKKENGILTVEDNVVRIFII